jgi:hypothetical protein
MLFNLENRRQHRGALPWDEKSATQFAAQSKL